MIRVPLDTLTTLEPGIAYTVEVFDDAMLGHVAKVRTWQMGDDEPITVEHEIQASYVDLTELPEGIQPL